MAWLETFWFGCVHCHDPAECPMAKVGESAPDGSDRADLRGLHLAVPALAVFILPLLVAIGGAYLAGLWWADGSVASLGRWQSGGAVTGLLVGVGVAKLLLGWLGRGRRLGEGET